MKNKPLFIAHQDAVQRSLRFLVKQPWSTFVTVLVIAVTLMLASLCWMATYQVTQLRGYWQRSGHISLYLRNDLLEADQQRFLVSIRETPGVTSAVLTSPAEGLELLSKQEGMEDMMRYLPQNPLPAVIDVLPDVGLSTPEALEHLSQTLKLLPEVEEVKLDLDWLGRLYSVLGFLTQSTKALMCLFAVTVMLVVGNTLRLIIYLRQEEIQVLQLLGATDVLIMRPFLYSGFWYGLFAACVAIVCVDIFLLMLRSGINQWAGLYQMHFSLPLMSVSQMFYLIVSAIFLGWLSARVTVKRYL